MGTYQSKYTGQEIDDNITKIKNLNVPTKLSEFDNDSGFISEYIETDPIYTADKPNIALKSEIPTNVSQLNNDKNFTTKAEVEEEIAKFDFIKVVDSLPATGLPNRIYFVPKNDTNTQDLFDEYAWINEAWEYITTKRIEVDLTSYATIDYVDGLVGDIGSLLSEV